MIRSRLIGVDVGSKRTGIALSDEEVKFAFPHSIVESRLAPKAIADLAMAYGVRKIIIGRSIDYRGNDNPISRKISQLVKVLTSFGLEVALEDERLTSMQASRSTAKSSIDSSAAALILQTHIDSGKYNQ